MIDYDKMIAERLITARNIKDMYVLDYCDPGDFPEHDIHGYEIGYLVKENSRIEGDTICGACAAGFMMERVKIYEEDDDEEWLDGVVPIYQGMAEIGDAQNVRCCDCNAMIYEGPEGDE